MSKIMIVDDSSIARKMVKIAIQNTEHSISGEADNGENAIIEFQRNKPDIVTLDYDMPVMNGGEAASRLLKMDPDVKIIFITANNIKDYNLPIDERFLVNSIIKPVTNKKLMSAIQNLLSQSNMAEITTVQLDPILEENLLLELDIEKGQLVTITHYSGVNYLRSIVTDVGINSISIKITKDSVLNNFFENEPVVIGFESSKQICLCEAIIKNISIRNRVFEVRIMGTDRVENSRKSERLAVSMYIEISRESKKGKIKAIVKDLSTSGMNLISNEDFTMNEKIDMDLFTESDVVNIQGEIKWKASVGKAFSYGVEIILKQGDSSKKKFLENYIKNVKKEHEKKILELRNL